MILALAQMKMEMEVEKNFNKSLFLLEKAAKAGADAICFPEIQLSPFFPQYENIDARPYAIEEEHPYFKEFCKKCGELNLLAVPNFYWKENGKYYDASFVISEKGKPIGKSKMVHITQAEQFYEKNYYTPSDEGFLVFDTSFGKMGIVICFDRHYPESIRTVALKGADVIMIPTANTKAEPMEMFEWEIRVQAFQSSVAIAMCNRVGVEDAMEFAGESLVVDANGEVLNKASGNEEMIFADIDLNASKIVREGKAYTQLRRKEWYQ